MPNRSVAHAALAATLLALSFVATPAEAQLATLTVHVRGADPATGTVEVSLFNSADTFMAQPFLQVSGVVGEDGSEEAIFEAVPTGEYAVVVAHDANDNGELDSGFLGFGGESYAWSNNVSPWFGWPEFDDAKFSVESDTEIEILLD